MITYERGKGWLGRVGFAAAAAAVIVVIACETPAPDVTDPRTATHDAAGPTTGTATQDVAGPKTATTLHEPMAAPPALPDEVVMARPLVLVDGQPAPEVEVGGPPEQRDWRTEPPRGDIRVWGVNPDSVDRIEVVRAGAATEVFGEAGKNGVVQITTKAGAESGGVSREVAKAPAPRPETKPVQLGLSQLPPGSVVIVDGVEVTPADVQLTPDEIERIEVFKGPAARAVDLGAQTVIHITTRR